MLVLVVACEDNTSLQTVNQPIVGGCGVAPIKDTGSVIQLPTTGEL